ncbi:MAG TPA: T9SS type A sorting domain-containing protein [Bacteroidales bacterium]|nr:T9SS type A sorting domain-containing protein [Bacteroidales bacterium]
MKAFFYSFALLAASFMAIGQPGTLDATFNPGSGANNEYVRRIIVQPDGKILASGAFTQFNGQNKPYLVRLNADGSIDESFNIGTGFNNPIGDIALQSDGKIVVGGSFSSFNGSAANYIVRLNPDGSRDDSFSSGIGPNGSIGCIALAPDGRIYISGNFSMFDNVQRLRIACLSSSGSLLTSFDPLGGLDGLIYGMKVQPDGKIVAGGTFTSYNNLPAGRIVRILPSGLPDPGFDPGTAVPSLYQYLINSISLQEDGKIIAAGVFNSFNNQTVKNIVRLMPNGQLDANFNPPVFNDQIESAVSLPNGKIAVVGRFTSGSSISRNRVAGLNSDGTMDMNFNPGTGASAITYVVTPYGSNKLMIGGFFTTYNGTSRGRIARINAESFTNLPETCHNEAVASVQWINSTNLLKISPNSNEIVKVLIYNAEGQMVHSQSTSGQTEIHLDKLHDGVYCFVLQGNQQYQKSRFMKF